MKILNLIDPTKGNISYKLSTFPDGEPHIILETIDRKDVYEVICRITNPNELFILMQVADILNRNEVIWDLKIYYLMSGRMDRVIHFEEAFSLKLVANIINTMNAHSVGIFHAHSNRTFELIKNSYELDKIDIYECMLDANVLCFPDAGAKERYAKKISKYDNYNWQFLTLNKVRDLENNGYIKSIDIVEKPDTINEMFSGHIMIIDDLCDAGGTFVLSAKTLHEKFPNAKLSIFIRHLVNPVGLKNLHENFDTVYITNSYREWINDIMKFGYANIKILNII